MHQSEAKKKKKKWINAALKNNLPYISKALGPEISLKLL